MSLSIPDCGCDVSNCFCPLWPSLPSSFRWTVPLNFQEVTSCGPLLLAPKTLNSGSPSKEQSFRKTPAIALFCLERKETELGSAGEVAVFSSRMSSSGSTAHCLLPQSFLLEVRAGPGDMAQWVNHSSCKCEFIIQNPH